MSSEQILILLTICLCLGVCLSAKPSNPPITDPTVYYTMVELVCADGYHIQEYNITTEDGYILKIHRIPNKKRRKKVPPRKNQYQFSHPGFHPQFRRCYNESIPEVATGPPVLLAHGLFSASDNWVLQGPGSDLAYLLVDAGYDVWFTNTRGNFYSREHTYLNTSNPKYWDFSFHESGIYDIPTTIDFVLEVTGYKKLTYIGHSMGTTMFFVMTSIKPEYNKKITLFVGLTPLGQIREENFSVTKNRTFAAVLKLLKAVKGRGVYEFGARYPITGIVSKSFCGRGSVLQDFCYDYVFSVFGYNSKLFLRKKFPLYLSHVLSGNSIKSTLHYFQMFNTPTFRQYDYGPEENLLRYGQPEPPDYDLSRVTTPTALFYSFGDYIVAPKDVELLIKALPNIIDVESVSKYSHIDFLWAYNAKSLIYPKILKLVDKYRKNYYL